MSVPEQPLWDTHPATIAPHASDAAELSGETEPDHLPAGGAPGLAVAAPEAAPVAPLDGLSLIADPDDIARADIAQLHAAALTELKAGNYPAAAGLFERVVTIMPASAAAHSNLAGALRRAGRLTEAEAQCRRAIALDPDHVSAHMNLGEILRDRHDIPAALACYDRVVRIDPDDPVVHNNAGLLLRKIGRLPAAQKAFERALALTPDDLVIRFNLLMTRPDDDGVAEATALCHRLLEQRPDEAALVVNLAILLQLAGRYQDALAQFERAVALAPDGREGRFNLSLLLLLLGDYARGWDEYERRWDLVEVRRPKFAQPEWQGEALDGKTILLHYEQGLGDTIQCLRFVPQVAASGGRVVLRIERALVRLAASLTDKVTILPRDARLPAFDVWCPLLSLPRILGTRSDTIPGAVPYLRPRAAVVERWARRLTEQPGLRVGLVWGGNAHHINDFRRSIDFSRLRPLLDVPGVRWFSLQVGRNASDVAALPTGSIVDLSAELTDFAETAGAVMNLDLVIAVDTAVVHLAGALARPAWVMISFTPDWRWMTERDDSPWYPTLRLYRQPQPGDWDSVIDRVAADLATLAADHTAR